jgi:DNA recombination protein RmuC
MEELQRDCCVMIAGPSTLGALLNSLQMGFRTLAIQKHTSEVLIILSDVKTHFGKFDTILKKVQKKLQEASNTVDKAQVVSRGMHKRLRNVELVDRGGPAALLLPSPAELDTSDDDDSDEVLEPWVQ